MIESVASNKADLLQLVVIERLLKSDLAFEDDVVEVIDRCENSLCKCCFSGQKRIKALRLRAARERILERPYAPGEGISTASTR